MVVETTSPTLTVGDHARRRPAWFSRQRMFAAFGLILVAVLAGLVSLGVQSAIQGNARSISFAADRVTFDTLSIGDPSVRQLSFQNVGSESLGIVRVAASCGCTSANVNRDVLLPGEHGILSVTLTGRPGMRAGRVGEVFIQTNREQAQWTIPVYVGAIEDLAVVPQVLDFGIVERPTLPISRAVYAICKTHSPNAPQGLQVETACDWIHVDQGAFDPNRNETVLRVSLAPHAPEGNAIGSLHISLRRADGRTMQESISVRAVVTDAPPFHMKSHD